jgi:hypothetical protein
MRGVRRSILTSPRFLLSVALIFLCGTMVGALGVRFLPGGRCPAQPAIYQDGGKQLSLERLTKELDLSQRQQAELETVLDDFVMYVQTIQAQMDDVRVTGKSRIMRVLDDQQKRKFENLLNEWQQVRR